MMKNKFIISTIKRSGILFDCIINYSYFDNNYLNNNYIGLYYDSKHNETSYNINVNNKFYGFFISKKIK